MIFTTKNKDYCGANALEIASSALMEADAKDYQLRGQSVRRFPGWSLRRPGNRLLPPRDADLSDHLQDEELALHYLCLRDEYGAGKVLTDTGEN